MHTITTEDLDRWGACGREDDYSDERLMRLTGKLEWTPLEISRIKWIPCVDRLWVLLQEEVLGDDLYGEAGYAYADRAVRKYALGSCIDEWAERWLDGDRDEQAARDDARAAAWAAEARWQLAWLRKRLEEVK